MNKIILTCDESICYKFPMMGNRLKHIMQREKVTAYQICKDLGIGQGHFSRFIKGEASFSLEKLEKIADYLGYDLQMVKRNPSRERSE
jgi:transcriptional regulator with XRE-family HTH domain